MNKALLKNKNYMLVVLGNFVSLMGSNIQQFVLSLYVFEKTGSAVLFASILAIAILPRLLLSPIAGVFGDWFDKKKSIIILDLLNAFILAGFAIYLFYNASLSIGLVYVMVILLEITEIFFHSSMSVVLPSVVKEEEYLDANAMRSMFISFGQLMAPVFGALIFGAFGLRVAIMINAVSFLFSAISEMFIQVGKTKSENNKKSMAGFKKDLLEGLKIVKKSKPIRTIISVAIIVNFSIAPLFSVGLVFLIREVLSQSELKLGILQSALSLSMILAPILLTKKIKKMHLGDVLNGSFTVVGILIMMISISIHQSVYTFSSGLLSYGIILVICFMIGIFITVVNISVQTMFQHMVPIEFMGRTSTVLGLFTAISIPLGQMLFGYLYDIINPGIVVILNGFIILMAVVLYYKRVREIAHYDNSKIKENLLEGSVA